MKQLILLLVLIIGLQSCGSDQHDNTITPEQMDSLIHSGDVLVDPAEKVMTLSPPGEELSPATHQPAIEVNPDGRILTVYMPHILNGPQIGHILVDVSFDADSVVAYSIDARSLRKTKVDSKPQISKTPTKSSPKLVSPRLIKKGDTKTSLARELGIRPDQIQNREPLQLGQVIIIK